MSGTLKPAPDLVERVAQHIVGATFGARGAVQYQDKIDAAARAIVALVLEEVSDMKFLVPLIEKQSAGEWPDSLIASDARMFSAAISALIPKEKYNE